MRVHQWGHRHFLMGIQWVGSSVCGSRLPKRIEGEAVFYIS